MRLVQITAGVAYGDAVTNYVFRLDRFFRHSGLFSSTRIYAETISGVHRVRHLSTFTPSKNDFIIYHHSVGLLYLDNFWVPGLTPLLIYHNITPPHYYVPWDFRAASRMELGKEQLQRLASLDLKCIALSEFSAGELRAAGFSSVDVLPYPPPDGSTGEPMFRPHGGDQRWKKWLKEDIPIVLFVGRIAPNKGIDFLLEAFAVLKKKMKARLILAGSFRSSSDRYGVHLRELVDKLNLGEEVCWTGYVSDLELATIYRRSSLYLSMSRHEGYGVPLVEAMKAQVPVLAYCGMQSSVAEVLGGAGIGFRVLDVEWAGRVAARVISDSRLRSMMIQGQQKRIAELESVDVLASLRNIVETEIHDRRNTHSDI